MTRDDLLLLAACLALSAAALAARCDRIDEAIGRDAGLPGAGPALVSAIESGWYPGSRSATAVTATALVDQK